ncbi:MAG TPA: tetratricopeptide repeat protein [Thermoanaerobaculia bacterium]
MKKTTKSLLVLLAVLSFVPAAGAQEAATDPHEFLLAKLASEEGRYDEAISHIDRVISRNPGNPVLLYERAMMLIDAGRIERAESELREVLAADPAFYDANRVLGRLLLDQAGSNRSLIEEAMRYLQAAYKANPDDFSSGLTVTQILRSLGRNAEAERILALMVERAPDQRALNFNYAQVLTTLGRGDESRKYLERTVAIDPTFGPAVMQLLDIYQQQNEWRRAAEVLEPIVADDPTSVEMRRQQAYFYLRAGDARAARDRFRTLVAADPKDARSLFYLAEALNDLEEYTEAEKIFRQLLATDPGDADLIASFALSLSGQKKWDEATRAFTQLLGLSGLPDNLAALARTQLAYIDVQKGNYAAAVETARNVFTFRDKPNPQAINIALEALKKEKKHADTVTLLEPLVQKFPDDPFLNARFVESLVRAGDAARAREHANTQAKRGTRNAIAIAEAYMQAEDTPAAIALIRSSIAARPDDLDLQFQLGSVLERADDRKASEAVFLKILEQNPDHAPSLNYLGYMWAESGTNLQRAEEMLTRAVGQEPENGAYVDSLGWVYFRLGNLELAEKYLTDATRLLPRDATIHEHLGDVLAKRGDMQRALKSYRTAVELDPESKDIDKIRHKIAEIERRGPASSTQR